MTKPNDSLIEIRKQFEQWGFRIRDENLLETYVPSYFKEHYYEQKEAFLTGCGERLALSDGKKGIVLEDPERFIEQMGGAAELKKIPLAFWKKLSIGHVGEERLFYFWFEYQQLVQLVSQNKLKESDVWDPRYPIELKEYRLQKAFQPKKAEYLLEEMIHRQVEDYRVLLNESIQWRKFENQVLRLLESEYEALIEKRQAWMAQESAMRN